MSDVEVIILELKRQYQLLERTGSEISTISSADFDVWSKRLGVTRSALYDLIALRLAKGFHTDEFPFNFCDKILNTVHGVITLADENRPELFSKVFLAFDEGEYYHRNNRAEDPVAKYTRPLIAQIVAKYEGK
jgi:hypothetical protein